jgi:hypothetical protein
MRAMKIISVLVIGGLGLSGLGVASPGSAGATGTTPMSVTITGGSLSITVPSATANMGSHQNQVAGETVSGPLGEVRVDDARNAVAGSGWIATVIATALTPPSGPAIAASALSYSTGIVTKVGTATYTSNDPADLTAVNAVVTATAITGDNAATWTPTISITIPGGMAAGVYTTTITHSVA